MDISNTISNYLPILSSVTYTDQKVADELMQRLSRVLDVDAILIL